MAEAEPIPEEELTEPVEKLLAKEARRIYEKETGKIWEESPPSEKEAKEFIRRAAKSIMERWQKGLKTYYEMTTTILGAPKPPEHMISYYHEGKIVTHRAKPVFTRRTYMKVVPLIDEEPAKIPPKAILKCPFDPTHGFSMRQIMPGLWQCVDDKTEVLTKNGFKLFKDVTYTDEIATLNPQTFELEFQRPTNIIAVPYKGKMIHFGGHRCNIDLMVTPNHQMFIRLRVHRYKRKPDYKWVFEDAEKVSKRRIETYEFKKDFEWHGSDPEFIILPLPDEHRPQSHYKKISPIPVLTYLKLMGWFISEGSVQGCNGGKVTNYAIEIGNSRKENLEEIASVVREIGLHPIILKDRVRFHSKHLHYYLRQFGNSGQKFIPDIIKNMSRESLRFFLKVLCKGDGQLKPDGEPFAYATRSKRLADDVQEIAIKAGFTANLYFNKNSGVRKTGCYYVYFSKNRGTPGLSRRPEFVDYEGYVYCVEVPNHIIYVRRNGKPVWIGNCTVDPSHVVSVVTWFPFRS